MNSLYEQLGIAIEALDKITDTIYEDRHNWDALDKQQFVRISEARLQLRYVAEAYFPKR